MQLIDIHISRDGQVHNNRVHYICLALLLAIGAGLRFYNIAGPGFTEGADFMYALTARTMSLIVGWGIGHTGMLSDPDAVARELRQLFIHVDHIPHMPYSCKPVYDFINVIMIGTWGYEDWVLPVGSAIAGVLGIGAVFLLATRIYDPLIGLVAAALLSVSGGGLIFSRYGQSHMLSLLFFTLGFWAYCQSVSKTKYGLRWLALAALCFGLTLATHPNMAPYIGVLTLGEVVFLACGRHAYLTVFKRFLVAVGTVAGLVLLLNMPFVLMKYFAGSFFAEFDSSLGWPFMTYLEQLPHHFGLVFSEQTLLGVAAPGIAARFYTYVVVFWAWEGLPIMCLAVVGAVLAVRNRRELYFFDMILVGQISIPLLFWIFSENFAVYRFSAGALPSVMIVAARALVWFALFISRRISLGQYQVLAGLCVLLMAYNVHNNWPIYQAQSAHKEAAQWLRAQGETSIVVNHPMTWDFYGVKPVSLERSNDVRYIGFLRRYMSTRERETLAALGDVEPVKAFAHKRPGKLLEVNLMQNSVVLKLLEYMPGLGTRVKQMRETVLYRNDLRRLEIYQKKYPSSPLLIKN
jgi:4-amino-4-deoxy-L-arabinose transferase-like glycosyltransferase